MDTKADLGQDGAPSGGNDGDDDDADDDDVKYELLQPTYAHRALVTLEERGMLDYVRFGRVGELLCMPVPPCPVVG